MNVAPRIGRSAIGVGLPLLAENQLRRGDIGAARAAAERGVALARAMGPRHRDATNLIALARARVAGGDPAGAEAALSPASELSTEMNARDLPPRIEQARAELVRYRNAAAGCERVFRAAARLHRENGEKWLATHAEARVGS